MIREKNTRAHALTAMLALKIRRHLAEAWKEENLTVEEGLRHLESFTLLRVDHKNGQSHQLLPQSTQLQARLLKAAGVKPPKTLPEIQAADVVTRKQLPEERKSH